MGGCINKVLFGPSRPAGQRCPHPAKLRQLPKPANNIGHINCLVLRPVEPRWRVHAQGNERSSAKSTSTLSLVSLVCIGGARRRKHLADAPWPVGIALWEYGVNAEPIGPADSPARGDSAPRADATPHGPAPRGTLIGLCIVAAAVAAGLGIAVGLRSPVVAQQAEPPQVESSSSEQEPSPVEHGRYLANDVAMCVMCHSPRDRSGNLLAGRQFRGAPMPVRSPFQGQEWAFTAPSIAGLPGGWSEADLVRLLTTGRRPDGTEPLSPMPPFRMKESDAKAVAAYLRQLR